MYRGFLRLRARVRIVQSVPFSVPFNSRQYKANLTQHIGIQNSRVVIMLITTENYAQMYMSDENAIF